MVDLSKIYFYGVRSLFNSGFKMIGKNGYEYTTSISHDFLIKATSKIIYVIREGIIHKIDIQFDIESLEPYLINEFYADSSRKVKWNTLKLLEIRLSLGLWYTPNYFGLSKNIIDNINELISIHNKSRVGLWYKTKIRLEHKAENLSHNSNLDSFNLLTKIEEHINARPDNIDFSFSNAKIIGKEDFKLNSTIFQSYVVDTKNKSLGKVDLIDGEFVIVPIKESETK